MLYDSVESTGIVDPGPILNANSFNIVTSRVWRHRVTWRHQWRFWRHQSTRREHLPIGSLLVTNPWIA